MEVDLPAGPGGLAFTRHYRSHDVWANGEFTLTDDRVGHYWTDTYRRRVIYGAMEATVGQAFPAATATL